MKDEGKPCSLRFCRLPPVLINLCTAISLEDKALTGWYIRLSDRKQPSAIASIVLDSPQLLGGDCSAKPTL